MFDVELSNLEFDGNLKLCFLEGFAVDNGGLKNKTVEIGTDIVVDNSIPVVQSDDREFTINTFDNNASVFSLN